MAPIRIAPVMLLLLALTACGPQGYIVLPAGDEPQLRRQCRVVLMTTVADRGIDADKVRVTQLFTSAVPVGAFLRWHLRFRVVRVLKGARADPDVIIADLAVQRTLPELPSAPVELLPIFLTRAGEPYEVGYNFELFGHFFGLTIMPESPSGVVLRQALHELMHSRLRLLGAL